MALGGQVSCSSGFDIFAVYAQYCDITLQCDQESRKASLQILFRSVEARGRMRDAIFGEIRQLMLYLNLSNDSPQFNCFYIFVFFILRENGQKSITVPIATTAWRLVLNGRFCLLDQWCNFVENYHKYTITEDTWQQLLAFSRCISEDLEGYDPKGAWPILIDDFAEHMRRCYGCSGRDSQICCCDETETQCSICSTFSGLNLLSGTKRKTSDMDVHGVEPGHQNHIATDWANIELLKRPKHDLVGSESQPPSTDAAAYGDAEQINWDWSYFRYRR